MPIRPVPNTTGPGEAQTLVCINASEHAPLQDGERTTMRRQVDLFALVGIALSAKANTCTETGAMFPVTCYSCNVCGYVELYIAKK